METERLLTAHALEVSDVTSVVVTTEAFVDTVESEVEVDVDVFEVEVDPEVHTCSR